MEVEEMEIKKVMMKIKSIKKDLEKETMIIKIINKWRKTI